MTENTSKLSTLVIYQSHLLGGELQLTESTAKLLPCPKSIKRLKNIYRVFFIIALLCLFCVVEANLQNRPDTLIIPLVIISGIFLFSALCFRLILPLHTVVYTLDLSSQCFHTGKRTLLFSDIQNITVRRNTYNERYRLGVVEYIPDEKLRNVTIDIKFKGRRTPLNFGIFQSTEVAFKYCNQLAELIGYNGTVKIDGEQKQ